VTAEFNVATILSPGRLVFVHTFAPLVSPKPVPVPISPRAGVGAGVGAGAGA